MFATDTQLLARLESVMHSELTEAQASVVSDRNEAAYNTIIAALHKRGLTKAQTDTWVRGKEFQLDISFFWIMSDLGWYKGSELEHDDLRKYNRVIELETVELLDSDGVEIGAASDGFAFKVINLGDHYER